MELSADLIAKMSNELMTQEVTRLVNIKREMIARVAQREINKVITSKVIEEGVKKAVIAQSKSFNKQIVAQVKNQVDDCYFSDAVEEIFERNDVVEGIIKDFLRKGIKIK